MSSREAVAACRMALQIALRATREDHTRETLTAALESLDAVDRADADRREQQREKKRRQRGTSPPVPGTERDSAGHVGTERGQERGGKGGGVISDLSDQDLSLKIPQSSSLGELERGPGDSAVVPGTPHASNDAGSWVGSLMRALEEGVRSVTGRPFPVRSGSPTSEIITAVRAHCPDPMGREDFARSKGAAWARVRIAENRTLNPFDFGQWLASGEPGPSRKPTAPDSEDPEQRARAQREINRKRDAEVLARAQEAERLKGAAQ